MLCGVTITSHYTIGSVMMSPTSCVQQMDDDVLLFPAGETMRSCTSSFVYKEPIGKGPFVIITHAQDIHGKTRCSHIFMGRIIIYQKGKRPRYTFESSHTCFSCCSFDPILLDSPFLPKAKKIKESKEGPCAFLFHQPLHSSQPMSHLNIKKVAHVYN